MVGKVRCLKCGLKNIHSINIVHRDFHSENIFFNCEYYNFVRIGDLGLSKSATAESTDDDNN